MRDETGLVIHGVSGSRHWQDPLSDPDPQVVARGMEAIRREFLDCKAYGGTTVLVVPAVVNRKVGYRDAYKRSQENIRKLIPEAEASGVKIAIEEVWNKFLLSPIEFARFIDEFESPWVAPISTSAMSSNSAIPKSGFASFRSASSRCTSRSMRKTSGSTTGWAKGEKSTGGPSRARFVTADTTAGSPRKYRLATWSK